MKMAKASERDIEAAGNAMSILNDISSGYYPICDNEEDGPTRFDPNDVDHLRRFYDLMSATLDKSPGWPSRVIGGMCYVILFDQNQIVDPIADTLEIHPRFTEVANQLTELVAATKEVIRISDRKHDAWDRAKAAIALVEGVAAIDSSERTCDQGCNGCDECTDYDHNEDEAPQ